MWTVLFWFSVFFFFSIGDILFSNYDGLATDHIVMLMSSLKVAYSFSHLANNTKEIWIANAVLRSGLLPLIIKQEANSITNYLRVLFRLYAEKSEDRAELAEPRILKRVREIIEEFLSLEVIVNSSQKTSTFNSSICLLSPSWYLHLRK